MADIEQRTGLLEAQMAHTIAVLDRVAENHIHLNEALATLAESHIRTQEQFRETDARMAKMNREFNERMAKMGRELDERIASLVSATAARGKTGSLTVPAR